MHITISEIIGSDKAILYSEGEKLYYYLNREFNINDLLDDRNITIDFKGINGITTSFINASMYRFLINNKSRLNSIEFIDTSQVDNILIDMHKLRIDKMVELAMDDELRIAYDKALGDLHNG